MPSPWLIPAAAALAWVAWRSLARAREFWARARKLSLLPHAPQGFLGALHLIADRDHMHHAFGRAAEELGGLCYARILWQQLVVVTDPSLCQQLLGAGMDLPKEPSTYHSFNMLTSPGGRTPNLLGHTTSHGYWHMVRKGVAPAFSPQNIRTEFPHVVQLCDDITAILHTAGPHAFVDIDNILQRESMDVIGRVGFQTDFGALKHWAAGAAAAATTAAAAAATAAAAAAPSEEATGSSPPGSCYAGSAAIQVGDVFQLTKGAALEIAKRWSQPLRSRLWWLLTDARRGEACLRASQARMHALLPELRARGPPPDSDTSIAAHLLRIRDPSTGRGLTDEQLAGEIGLFFFAGFETTGHTAAWALYFLASFPEAAEKVAAELDALGLLVTPARPHPRPLQYADLSKLRYLGQVIKESMRLVPVVAGGTARRTPRDITLRGHNIPAGTMLIVGGIGLHHSRHNWERPLDFLPDRWCQPGAEYWPGERCPGGVRDDTDAGGQAAASPHPPQGDGGIDGSGGSSGPAHGASGSGADARGGLLPSQPPPPPLLLEEEGALAAGSGDKPPLRFAPFQQGPRNCIGQNLAKMNYTATLAVLLSRFTFHLAPELQGPGALWGLQCNLMTNQPKGGLPMRCVPRLP